MSSSIKKLRAKSYPRDVMEQAHLVRTGWEKVGKKLAVPNLTVHKFLNELTKAEQLVDHAEQLKLERSRAIKKRNICLGELWDLTKRIRNAAKATFGDYSRELEVLMNPEMSSGDSDSQNNK